MIKLVSMTRKYHNYKLQTKPRHREEEPHNNHETPERQTKHSNKLSLPHRDDCKTRMDTKSLSDDNQAAITDAFNSTSRYLDGILIINAIYFENMIFHNISCRASTLGSEYP